MRAGSWGLPVPGAALSGRRDTWPALPRMLVAHVTTTPVGALRMSTAKAAALARRVWGRPGAQVRARDLAAALGWSRPRAEALWVGVGGQQAERMTVELAAGRRVEEQELAGLARLLDCEPDGPAWNEALDGLEAEGWTRPELLGLVALETAVRERYGWWGSDRDGNTKGGNDGLREYD